MKDDKKDEIDEIKVIKATKKDFFSRYNHFKKK